MAGFEPYDRDAEAIEREIACRGMLLGIDWDDTAQLRLLATEMLDGGAELVQRLARSSDARERARGELFALAILMQQTMAESAGRDIHTHGGRVWKALGRALFDAAASRRMTNQ
ncbi:MAG: hypothetical protein KDG52_04445 [Rhodocyclaceae bacterium]|nr:hypothetical protein [Rhodocyclaceae bacterium]